jgi:hypothetical protein
VAALELVASFVSGEEEPEFVIGDCSLADENNLPSGLFPSLICSGTSSVPLGSNAPIKMELILRGTKGDLEALPDEDIFQSIHGR